MNRIENRYKGRIAYVYERGAGFYSRCKKSSSCEGAFVVLCFLGFWEEICLENYPRKTLEFFCEKNFPVFVGAKTGNLFFRPGPKNVSGTAPKLRVYNG
jgi:hypothetical protein